MFVVIIITITIRIELLCIANDIFKLQPRIKLFVQAFHREIILKAACFHRDYI